MAHTNFTVLNCFNVFFFEVYGILISIARHIRIKYFILVKKGIDNIMQLMTFLLGFVCFFFRVIYGFKGTKTLLIVNEIIKKSRHH